MKKLLLGLSVVILIFILENFFGIKISYSNLPSSIQAFVRIIFQIIKVVLGAIIIFSPVIAFMYILKNSTTSRIRIPPRNRNVEKKDKEKQLNSFKKFNPFFFIPNNAFGGLLILLFFTWLIFGVIFDIGTELGSPRFFGHDGG